MSVSSDTCRGFCIILPRNDCIILNCATMMITSKFRPIKTHYRNLDRAWLLEHNNSWCINNKRHCDHQRKNTRAMLQIKHNILLVTRDVVNKLIKVTIE